uniref:Putative ovule protein n=1 Tax=Solanum chacoense TaxID=4108 RepID=A0A0V0H7I5_SOLCH
MKKQKVGQKTQYKVRRRRPVPQKHNFSLCVAERSRTLLPQNLFHDQILKMHLRVTDLLPDSDFLIVSHV